MRRSSTPASDRPARAAGILLIAVGATGALLSVLGGAVFAARPSGSVVDGTWSARWQAAYEEALPVRDDGTALWTLIRYRLFGEARPEVLVGTQGWLYSAEEFDPPEPLAVALEQAVARVAAVRDDLGARGIELVVALVPTKACVEESHLGGRYAVPASLAGRYARALDLLAGRGIAAPDLLSPLRAAGADADMYLRTDTHWTPQGARTAADVLAQAIVPLLVKHGSTRLPFSAHDAGERVVEGDLLKFIPLGPWQRLGPAPDRVTQTVTTLEGDSAASDLFADLDIPVALTGTSYSIAAVSDFEGALKVALQADVLNVAAEGQGPFAPMEAYLASTAIDEARPAVVVWEIPERYLESEK